MNLFTTTSAALAVILYVPLCIQIYQGKVKQNFTTWMLWTILDIVITTSLIIQNGNYFLSAAYLTGGLITSLIILRSKNISFSWFDYFISFLVFVCLIVWFMLGAESAIIASTLAGFIAGIPQIVEIYKHPKSAPLLIYYGYIIVNVLSIIGGKSWTVEERLFPTSGLLLSVIVIMAGSRRYLKIKMV